ETTWQHVLNQIPGVAVGLGSRNSFGNGAGNSYTTSFADSPISPQILQIGGALPYESSATIDGMPLSTQTLSSSGMYGNGGVDLGVLAPGAFSQYAVDIGPGADSPSIVNSVGGDLELTPDIYVAKNSANFSVGDDPYGGIVSNATLGWRIGKLSASFTYSLEDSPGPLGRASSTGRIPFATRQTIYAIDGKTFACSGAKPGAFGYCYNNGNFPGVTPPGYLDNCAIFDDTLIACCNPALNSAWNQ